MAAGDHLLPPTSGRHSDGAPCLLHISFCIDDVSRDTKLSDILAKVLAWARNAGMAVPDARDLAINIKVPKTYYEIEVLNSDADAKQVDLFNNAADIIIVHVVSMTTMR